jgi:hypothetical protein
MPRACHGYAEQPLACRRAARDHRRMKLALGLLLAAALAGPARANGVGDMWNDAKNTTRSAAKDTKKNAHDMFKRDKKKKPDEKSK